MSRTVTIEAAVVDSAGAEFTFLTVQLDSLQPHEVRLEIKAAALCHTDVTVAGGGLPFPLPGVLGHEGVGIVTEVGSAVTRVQPGDTAVLSYTSCGRCAICRGAIRPTAIRGCRTTCWVEAGPTDPPLFPKAGNASADASSANHPSPGLPLRTSEVS